MRLEWRDGSPAPAVVNVAGSRLTAGEGADHWFSVAGEIDFDDGEVVSFLDLLRRLPERGGRYVRLDEGRYLRLTDTLRKRLEAFAGGVEKGDALRLAPAALLPLAQAFEESPDGRAPSRPAGGPGAAEAPVLALPPALAARADSLRKLLAAPVPPPPVAASFHAPGFGAAIAIFRPLRHSRRTASPRSFNAARAFSA